MASATPALRMEAPVAPEGPSSILDRWARGEIDRAEAQRLRELYDSTRPKLAIIVCECGNEFNDDGERTLCGECEYEREAERWNDMRGED